MSSAYKDTFTLVRHEGDVFAGRGLDEALELANPDVDTDDPVEWARVKATDACAARLFCHPKVWREVSARTLERYWRSVGGKARPVGRWRV